VPGTPFDGAAAKAPIDPQSYPVIGDAETLGRWIAVATNLGNVGISLLASSEDAMRAELIGIAFALAPGKAGYLPLGHRDSGALDFAPRSGQLDEKTALAALKPLLEDPATLKIGHDLKFAARLLLERGIALGPSDDVMLMSYVKDAGIHGHGLEELAQLTFGHVPVTLASLTGKGREKIALDRVGVGDAARYAGERADIALRLHTFLKPGLNEARRLTVYETLERPLIPVVARMEQAGITIDPDFLSRLSNDFATTMAKLEEDIYKLAGERFNLGSPKQLGDILFDKLSLPGGRRTRTGAWSTDADILEELAALGHDLPGRILEWRLLSKLKSTYTDALPLHINPRTGRVHTCFQLAATSTGRISSTEPNLQNIPIRTEEGRRIRRAFVAAKGKRLISADYSQIELRLLAHIAEVPALRQAFADGIDIHAMTASEMFAVPLKDMTSTIRSRAKAINFGIIYGISAFGLANQLGIPRGEADAYIKKYFERFPGIRDYMERTKEFVRRNGYVETVFGRRIHIKDVKAQSAAQRAFGERQAINAPIQGSAADVIRRAMVRLPQALANHDLGAQLLLQVHDELVIEAAEEDADRVAQLAREVMEKAPLPALELRVPLVVDARAGANWGEAH
jgi:DNA polymerase-1